MTEKCGKYVGDNDATSPQLHCIRERGHTGLCDNTFEGSDEELENILMVGEATPGTVPEPVEYGSASELAAVFGTIEGIDESIVGCAVCGEPMTVEHTITRRSTGRWVAWPPVIDEKGRKGHTECFIKEGTVSLSGRTGPEFLAELDAGYVPTLAERILKPPPKGVFYLDVMKVSSCTCDAFCDGPCPVHGAEMAAQDARIAEENAKGGFIRTGVARLLGGEPFRTPLFVPETSERETRERIRDELLNSFLSQCGHPRPSSLSREDRDALVEKVLAPVKKEPTVSDEPEIPDSVPTTMDVLASAVAWCSENGLGKTMVCDAVEVATAHGWDPTLVPSSEQAIAMLFRGLNAESEERARKAEVRARFAWTCLRAPEPPPCANCGRLVLAGRCCDKPEFGPYPPPIAELAQALYDAEKTRDGYKSALENVRLLAMRMRRTDPNNAEHLLDFCREVGVVGSILREEEK